MAAYKTEKLTRNQPAKTTAQVGVVAVRGEFDLSAALALDDTIDMVEVPAGHVPFDVILDADDLDTGTPAITLSVGLRKADGTTDDPVTFITASTVAQAAVGMVRMTNKAGLRCVPAAVSRAVYVTVAAAPDTGTTSGKIGVTVLYRPA